MLIPHDQLNTLMAHRVRAAVCEETVEQYAQALRDGIVLPPAIVFYDGATHWMADGLHRYHGSLKAGLRGLECEIRPGTQGDALKHALNANTQHGLKRSRLDRKRAVESALEEFGDLPSSQLAALCGVSLTYAWMARQQNRPKALTVPAPFDGQQHQSYLPVGIPEYDLVSDGSDLPPKVLRIAASTVMRDALSNLERLRRNVRTAGRHELHGKWFDPIEVLERIKGIEETLMGCDFDKPCPDCGGKGCNRCRFTGWVPKGAAHVSATEDE